MRLEATAPVGHVERHAGLRVARDRQGDAAASLDNLTPFGLELGEPYGEAPEPPKKTARRAS